MLFGVFLSLGNHKYFNNKISIIAEFVPQVIFLCGMFGYLAFLMIIKWWIYEATNDPAQTASSQGCAPSVLITFINMVLFKSEEPLEGCETVYMMGGFQHFLQVIISTEESLDSVVTFTPRILVIGWFSVYGWVET